MTRNETVLSIGLAFAIGCAVAPVAQQYVVRPAGAAPAGVQRWEQYCSLFPSLDPVQQARANEAMKKVDLELRNRGLEGWELTSTLTTQLGGGTD
jgi:hypothetical protein